MRSRPWCLLMIVAVGCGGGDAATDSLGQALNATPPEPPAIPRDVHLIDGGQFTRPAIPPLRSSLDGRVAIEMTKQRNTTAALGDPHFREQSVAFSLFVPEGLSTHWAAAVPGVSVVPDLPIFVPLDVSYGHPWAAVDSSAFDHRTLCDGWAIDPGDPFDPADPTDAFDPYFPSAPPAANPFPCPADVSRDCYDLTIVSDFEDFDPADNRKKHQLSGKPVRVKVAEPKTATAHIVEVITDPALLGTDPGGTGSDVRYGPWLDVDFMLEPMITRDGHLLVMRLGNSNLAWDNPATPFVDPAANAEIVYSVAPQTAPRCDVTAWQVLHPISHAHHDTANTMSDRYGFARYSLRDGEGQPIADGVDLGASYPWIDRDGDNLFFSLLSSTYFYDDAGTAGPDVTRRLPGDLCIDGTTPGTLGATCGDPLVATSITSIEEDKPFRGFGFAGLWSHGKVVLLDNLTNNLDFGLGRENADQRLLPLYRTAAGATEWVRIGTGRDNSGQAIPDGATQNSTFIDSWEQLFNHAPVAVPATVRDVVWIMNTGKASAEVAFDDYLDAEAFIVSEMSGSWSHTPPAAWPGAHQGTYHDGFTQTALHAGSGYDAEVRVQNAATTTAAILPTGGPLATEPDSIAEAWVIPPYGVVENGARIEPAALGGITGKGLWLDGADDLIRYHIDPQPVEPAEWYLGIFVDPRWPNTDRTVRPLILFPGGARIDLIGLDTLRITSAGGVVRQQLLSLPLVQNAWRHLGFAIRNSGREVKVLIDGYPLAQLSAPAPLVALLGPAISGDLRIGGDGVTGVKGWIDELKVLAYLPSIEVTCNHAHGTLVALDSSAAAAAQRDPADTAAHAALVAQAATYPAAAHTWIAGQVGAPLAATFVCLHDYTVDAEAFPLMASIPVADVPVRDALLLSGPLVHDVERPDSHANRFCLSCHKSGNAPSLGLVPLARLPGLTLENDPRRQPMQPPQWLFGNLPPGYFDAFGSGLVPPPQAPAGGENTDPYVYP